jgi:hypothetical protein
LAFSPSSDLVVLSQAGRKIQKLLELPPIPAFRIAFVAASFQLAECGPGTDFAS